MLPAQKRGDPVREPRKVSPSPTGFRGTVPACGKRRGLVSTEGHSPETFGGGCRRTEYPDTPRTATGKAAGSLGAGTEWVLRVNR